jgi:hypothetical protein
MVGKSKPRNCGRITQDYFVGVVNVENIVLMSVVNSAETSEGLRGKKWEKGSTFSHF